MPRGALIQIRRSTASEWTTRNPILEDGEWGYERVTTKMKMGDGVSTWAELDYQNSLGAVASVNGHIGTVTLGYADVGADEEGAATAALGAAQAYTVSQIAAATTSIEAYANSAASSAASGAVTSAVATAKTYTDGQVTVLTTALESYATSADTAVLATAGGYTDTEVASAISMLETYANSAVATEQARALGVESLKADLVAGKVPTSQLPALATFTTHSVASQADMLALSSAVVGDVALRTDEQGARWILTSLPPSTLANWLQLEVDPSAAVDSINGHIGTVILGYADVGADISGAATGALTAAQGYTDSQVSASLLAAETYADSAAARDWIIANKAPYGLATSNTAAANDTALAAAITAAGSNGTIYIERGIYLFNAAHVIPNGVDIRGCGGGSTSTTGATVLKGNNAAFQIKIAGGGSISGFFQVHGNLTATTPFYRDGGTGANARTFQNITVLDNLPAGVTNDLAMFIGAQNDVWIQCGFGGADRDIALFSEGYGGAGFYRCEWSTAGRYHIRFDASVTNPFQVYAVPTDITFHKGICEGTGGISLVSIANGQLITFEDYAFFSANALSGPAFAVATNCNGMQLHNPYFQSTASTQTAGTVAIYAVGNGDVTITGRAWYYNYNAVHQVDGVNCFVYDSSHASFYNCGTSVSPINGATYAQITNVINGVRSAASGPTLFVEQVFNSSRTAFLYTRTAAGVTNYFPGSGSNPFSNFDITYGRLSAGVLGLTAGTMAFATGVGTTSQRPVGIGTTIAGSLRGNSTLDGFEGTLDGQTWRTLLSADKNLSELASAGAARANLHIPALSSAQAVATTNQALTGQPVLDTYATTNNDTVLLTAQTTNTQNGPWQLPATGTGAWARPTDFATGLSTKGRTIEVVGGSMFAGTAWALGGTANTVVDTSAQTWTMIGNLKGSATPLGMSSTPGVGTGANVSHEDHVHPATSTPSATTAVGFLVNLLASQISDAFQVLSSSSSVLANISAAGVVQGTQVWDNGSRVYSLSNPPPSSGVALSAATPSGLGTAANGADAGAARGDHVHSSVVTSVGTTSVALVAKGVASQSADLFEAQNSSSVVVASITAAGLVNSTSLAATVDANIAGSTGVDVSPLKLGTRGRMTSFASTSGTFLMDNSFWDGGVFKGIATGSGCAILALANGAMTFSGSLAPTSGGATVAFANLFSVSSSGAMATVLGNATNVGHSIKLAPSASGDALQILSSASAVLARIDVSGNIQSPAFLSTTAGKAVLRSNFDTGGFTITTGADANKGLVVKGNSATQSANPLEVQLSTGVAVAKIDSLGNATFANASGFYGDGSDGAAVFDGTTTVLGIVPSVNVYTIPRDMFFTNCTVNSGVSLRTNSYRIFCRGTLTNNGTIHANGITSVNAASGTATSATSTFGQNGGAGIGGNSSAGGGSTAQSTAGMGGQGGTGGSGTSGTGGSGGAIAESSPARGALHSLPGAVIGSYQGWAGSFVSAPFQAGSGGGSGAGDGTNSGGGGGGAGSPLGVFAYVIAGTGAIQSRGGGGGAASASSTTGAGGGGGGGGGYVVVMSSSVLAGAVAGQTIDAAGGAGGVGHGTAGTNGTSGGSGTVVLLQSL